MELELEDVGENYVHELVRRSFLQNVDFEEAKFEMHDLVHDLAQFVAGT